MRNLIWFLALFLLLLIQSGIFLPLHIAPVSLILIVVAMAAILSDFNQGLIITLIGGVLLDFVSGTRDGLMSVSLIGAFLTLHLALKEILSREPNRFILAVSVSGSTIVFFIIYLVLSRFLGQVDAKYLLTTQLPLTLLWNLIFAYPIFKYYSLIQNLASKLPSNEEPIRN